MNENDAIISGFSDSSDDSLSLKLRRIEGNDKALLVELTGYIDTYNTAYFSGRMAKIINTGYIYIVFDCHKLSYMSSTGIGSFTSVLKSVTTKGGNIALYGIQSKIMDVLQLLGFSQFFNIAGTYEEAMRLLFKKESSSSQVSFPITITCPVCRKKLRVPRPGKFRCAECKAIIAIMNDGRVMLG